MNIKNTLRVASFVLLLAISLPASSASIVPVVSEAGNIAGTENMRADELVRRLEDIRSINKSELTRLERKSLRKELKAIKKEMKAVSGGVYLSVGAIIIIILLLILIL